MALPVGMAVATEMYSVPRKAQPSSDSQFDSAVFLEKMSHRSENHT
jgi:hypothetical protein